MAPKRKRDVAPVARPKSKKLKKKVKKTNGGTLIPAENNFEVLPSDGSDSDVIFNHGTNRNDDIVLVDSDEGEESDIVVLSDEGDDDEEPLSKKQKFEKNELAKNADFIEFGFSSSEEDNGDENEYSDDGILSHDEQGNIYIQSESKSPYPWVKDHDHSKQKEIADWLTMEMKDFVNYISPSSDEIHTRNMVINTLKTQINNFWPQTEAHVFGSCATDLYLPGSDIDMVVVSDTGDYEERSRLYQLSSFLRNRKLAKNIEVIAKAKVPIIKFVDPGTNIHIDVSFERTNGLVAAKKIRNWLASTPGLRELVLIVKQFLRSRKLNYVHVGGLGGYATIIMCYHFLKLHPKVSTGSMSILDNLGALLIEFFELYGRNFSYDNLILSLDPETDLPRYLLKKYHSNLNSSRNPFCIIIQDPSDPSNNITRASYNLRDLKKAFGGAYQLLTDKCYRLNSASYKERLGELILGDIIKITGKERDFNDDRHKVTNEALINHEGDKSGDESEGLDGNDKYYFSDMTIESEDELKVYDTDGQDKVNGGKIAKSDRVTKPNKVTKSGKVAKPDKVTKNDEKKTEINVEQAKSTKKVVSDYLGLNKSDDDEDTTLEHDAKNEEEDIKKSKIILDKDIKRDFWRQKGLEL